MSSIIIERLSCKGQLSELLQTIGTGTLREDHPTFSMVILIDALDRYVHPARLMDALIKLVETHNTFLGFKVIATCGESVYETFKSENLMLPPQFFYTVRMRDEDHDGEQSEVRLDLLSDAEMQDLFTTCQSQPGHATRTKFAELSPAALNSLRNPLLFKLAMQVYDEREIPRRSLAGEVLLDYSKRKIFNSPAREDFINNLVDFMIDHKTRLASFEQLLCVAQLRDAMLDESENSPYRRLIDEQIIMELHKSIEGPFTMIHDRMIEFAYDKLFEYLVLTRMAKRFRLSETTLKTM
ncbi:MAG: hypothetical protein HQK65_21915, partial [Desulfamplus sp.]|nr:hypothetical protein [Desulfamplus sp.]